MRTETTHCAACAVKAERARRAAAITPTGPPERMRLTPEREAKLLAAVRSLGAPRAAQLGLMAELALETGARSGELCGARWEDIDPDRGSWTIHSTKDRAGERRAPLTSRAKQILAELEASHADGGPLLFSRWKSPIAANAVLLAASSRAGLGRLRFPELRQEAWARMLAGHPEIPKKALREMFGKDSSCVAMGLAPKRGPKRRPRARPPGRSSAEPGAANTTITTTTTMKGD